MRKAILRSQSVHKEKREKRGEKKEKKIEYPHTHICLDRSWRCLLQRDVAATRRLRVTSALEARRTSRPATRTTRIRRTRVSSTRRFRRVAKRIRYTRAPNTWTAVRTSKTSRRTRRRTHPSKREKKRQEKGRIPLASFPPSLFLSLPFPRTGKPSCRTLSRRTLAVTIQVSPGDFCFCVQNARILTLNDRKVTHLRASDRRDTLLISHFHFYSADKTE